MKHTILLTSTLLALLTMTLQAQEGALAKSSSTPPGGNSRISFASAAHHVLEGRTLRALVHRSGNWGVAHYVEVHARAGSASEADFSFPVARIYFAAGDTRPYQEITLDAVSDSLAEEVETLDLVFENNSGGDLGNTSASIEILDSSIGQIAFGNITNEAAEASASALITLQREGGSRGRVEISWATVETFYTGSATPESDYVPSSGTVVFEEGQSSATFTVPVLVDSAIEANEVVEIHLNDNYSGATLVNLGGFLQITDSPAQDTSDVVGGFNSRVGANGPIHQQVILSNGSSFVRGNFTTYDGTPRKGLAKLNSDGTLDAQFGYSSPSQVHAMIVQPDGKVLCAAGGDFFRLNSDGQLDATFNGGSFGLVESVETLPDGKVIVAGWLSAGAGYELSLARLNSDGSLDTTFARQTFASSSEIKNVRLLGNYIYVAGKIITPTQIQRIARFAFDGAPDTAFQPNLDGPVSALAVSGEFLYVGGAFQKKLVRLDVASGVQDTSFAPSVDGAVHAISVRSSGEVLIGGDFLTVGTNSAARIAQLTSSGELSASYGSGADGNVYSVAVATGGEIQIAGNFHFVDGVGRNYLARVQNKAIPQLAITPSGDGRLKISWPVACGTFVLEKSEKPGDQGWTPVSTTPAIENDRNVIVEAINGPVNFYRLRR